MKYDSVDDGRERLDDLAQTQEAILETHLREAQRLREYQCGPYHDWQEFIDANSGGFIRCSRCGAERDCEDPDGDLG
jgi:hypothetical protein